MTIFLNFLWENFVNSQNYCNFAHAKAQMAESVDALVSNTSGAIRAGSTPALGTTMRLTSSLKHPKECRNRQIAALFRYVFFTVPDPCILPLQSSS